MNPSTDNREVIAGPVPHLDSSCLGMRPGNDRDRSPETMVEETLTELHDQFPDKFSNVGLARAVRSQLQWAVSKETQICNELVGNAPDDKARNILASRVQTDVTSKPRKGPAEWLKNPYDVIDAAIQRMCALAPEITSDSVLREVLVDKVGKLVDAETRICHQLIQQSLQTDLDEVLAPRSRPALVVQDASGARVEQRLNTVRWGEWYPGLDTDHISLREILNTLPGFPPEKVPEIVRRYENPESPEQLPGAVTLLRHDLIHILLGRGLQDQDEAFVIGFTMGSAKEDLLHEDEEAMEQAFRDLYPEPYRIKGKKLKAFRLGVQAGREIGIDQMWMVKIEDMLDCTVGEVRDRLGISVEKLREFYRREKKLIPNSLESARLPV